MTASVFFSNALTPLFVHIGRITAAFVRKLFPAICVVCEKKQAEALGLCRVCSKALPVLHYSCQYCGLPVYSASRCCGACAVQRPDHEALWVPFRYASPIDRLVKRLKYGQKLEYVVLLGRLFLRYLETQDFIRPDYLIPVPIHPSKLRHRGFNQALELARFLGRALNIPVLNGLEKTRRTLPQSSLPYHRRRTNLKGTFKVNSALIRGAHMAIIDDVVTTGATVSEVTRVLKKSGAARVDVWCMARTVLD